MSHSSLYSKVLTVQTAPSFAVALLGIIALGFAYGSQYFGFSPCTICIEIRFVILLGIILSLLNAFLCGLRLKAVNALKYTPVLAYGAATAMATRLALIEEGIIDATGCTPFTFYHQYLPFHEMWPDMFQPQGLCGEASLILPWLSYSHLSVMGIGAMTVAAFVMVRKKLP